MDTSSIESSEGKNNTQTFPLPSSNSSWKLEHLLSLNITPVFSSSTTANHFVGMLIEKNTPEAIQRNALLDLRVNQMAQDIRKTLAFRFLNSSLEDIVEFKSTSDIVSILKMTSAWQLNLDMSDEEFSMFQSRFELAGIEFTEMLLECINQRNRISEYMYQHLFINFLQLFDIRCQFAPTIPLKDMKIRKRKSSGMPDIIAKIWRNNEESNKCDWKTLFVGKVQKNYVRNKEEVKKKSRQSTLNPAVSGISDSVLGQHGADLLTYLNTSVIKDTIIGFIVEHTHVTFTRLTVTEEQQKGMVEDKVQFDREHGPEILFTRPYDYMMKEDRNCLIEPLLKIGLLQNESNSFFN